MTIRQYADEIERLTALIGNANIPKRLVSAAQKNTYVLKAEYGAVQAEYRSIFLQLNDLYQSYVNDGNPTVFFIDSVDQDSAETEGLIEFDSRKIDTIGLTILLALSDTKMSDGDLFGKNVLENLLRKANYPELANYAHYYVINWLEDLRQAYTGRPLPLYHE